MERSKLIYIRWGRGKRRVRVKDIRNYFKVGKFGRFNIYSRKKKKKKALRSKIQTKKARRTKKKIVKPYTEQVEIKKGKGRIRVSSQEKEFIRKIKGKPSFEGLNKEKEIEKKLLKRVQLLPRFDKFKYMGEINKDHKIISNGKIYGSFHALDDDKRDVYLNLMKGLLQGKNDKFRNKLYALRKELLKDGLIIEIDVYGTLYKGNIRKKYFGTLEVVGLMVEEAGFIESDLIGFTGENREIERHFDNLVRGLGGKKCSWKRNNLRMDTINVTITDIQLRLNYA